MSLHKPSPLVSAVLFGALVLLAIGAGWWVVITPRAGAAKPASPTPPAKVAKTIREDQLNTIVLRPEAIKRLALRTALVERKPVQRMRVYGGEVMVPPGQSVLVAAPVCGTLRQVAGMVPRAGARVKAKDVLFELLPLLTPEGRATLAATTVEADGQVKTAQAQLEGTNIALTRADRVFRSAGGSRRAVDEAQALVDVARKTLEAAKARRDLLRRVVGDLDSGATAPIPVESPGAGLLRSVSALPGQSVPAGAALFEVLDLSRVWIRVPVYVGDLPDLDEHLDATVGPLTVRPGDPTQPAAPVTAPPSANATAGTVDLFYGLDNEALGYSPGQRVGVRLPLKGKNREKTVPCSAVVYDIHGGAWLYEETGTRTYVRRRVLVRFVSGETAVLAEGPPVGARVVVAGAAELFGAETGFTK